MKSTAGFSITELVVVVAIILVVSSISLPSISRTIDNVRLKSAAQQIAGIYQQARLRATHDNAYYNVLVSPPGMRPAQICVDLNSDGACSANEPEAQLPMEVNLSNNGLPLELDAATLGFTPYKTETSATYNQAGNIVAGLAWNSRGLPCQKVSSTSPCANWVTSPGGAGPVGWIQYLQLLRSTDEALYAAVTVSPGGKVKMWNYAPLSGGGKGWF